MNDRETSHVKPLEVWSLFVLASSITIRQHLIANIAIPE